LIVAKSSKILRGKGKIAEYIGCGVDNLSELARLGMPFRIVGVVWYAYADNVDMFFQRLTLAHPKEIDEELEK